MVAALAIARLSQRASRSVRNFSTTPLVRNTAAPSASMPLGESVRTVAEQAQQSLAGQATAEGFKAGVLYTLLAGSMATGAIIMLSPDGDRQIKGGDLL